LDDTPGEVHRRIELREVADAERAARRDTRELEVQALRVGERAFRADQQMRRIGMRRTEVIEVVARHLAQELREARLDLGLLALVQALQDGKSTRLNTSHVAISYA